MRFLIVLLILMDMAVWCVQTIRCQVSAPDDVIARTYDHAPSGGFTLHFTEDGAYRLTFADAERSLRGACQIDVFAVYSPE